MNKSMSKLLHVKTGKNIEWERRLKLGVSISKWASQSIIVLIQDGAYGGCLTIDMIFKSSNVDN